MKNKKHLSMLLAFSMIFNLFVFSGSAEASILESGTMYDTEYDTDQDTIPPIVDGDQQEPDINKQTILDISKGNINITPSSVTGFRPNGSAAKVNPLGYEITGTTTEYKIVADAVPITIKDLNINGSLSAIDMTSGGEITVLGTNTISRDIEDEGRIDALINHGSGSLTIKGDGEIFSSDANGDGATIGGQYGKPANVTIAGDVTIRASKTHPGNRAPVIGVGNPRYNIGSDLPATIVITDNAKVDVNIISDSDSPVIGTATGSVGNANITISGKAQLEATGGLSGKYADETEYAAPVIGVGENGATANINIEDGALVKIVPMAAEVYIAKGGMGTPTGTAPTENAILHSNIKISAFANVEAPVTDTYYKDTTGTQSVYRILAKELVDETFVELNYDNTSAQVQTNALGKLYAYLPKGAHTVFINGKEYRGTVESTGAAVFETDPKTVLDISLGNITITKNSVTGFSTSGRPITGVDINGYEIVGRATTNTITVRDAVPISIKDIQLDYVDPKIGSAINMVNGGEITLVGTNHITRYKSQLSGVPKALIGQNTGGILSIVGKGVLNIHDADQNGATIGGHYNEEANINISGDVTINAEKTNAVSGAVIGSGAGAFGTNIVITGNAKVNAINNNNSGGDVLAPVIGAPQSTYGASRATNITISGNAEVKALAKSTKTKGSSIGTTVGQTNMRIEDSPYIETLNRGEGPATGTSSGMNIGAANDLGQGMAGTMIQISPFAYVDVPAHENNYRSLENYNIGAYRTTIEKLPANTRIPVTYQGKTVSMKTNAEGKLFFYLPSGKQSVIIGAKEYAGAVSLRGTTVLVIITKTVVDISKGHVLIGKDFVQAFTLSGEKAEVNPDGYEITGLTSTNFIVVYDPDVPIAIRNLNINIPASAYDSNGAYVHDGYAIHMTNGGNITVLGTNTINRPTLEPLKKKAVRHYPVIGHVTGKLTIEGEGTLTINDKEGLSPTIGSTPNARADIRIRGDVKLKAYKDINNDLLGLSPVIGGGVKTSVQNPGTRVTIEGNANVLVGSSYVYYAPVIGASAGYDADKRDATDGSKGGVHVNIRGHAMVNASNASGIPHGNGSPVIGSDRDGDSKEVVIDIGPGAYVRASNMNNTPYTRGDGMGMPGKSMTSPDKTKITVSPLANVQILNRLEEYQGYTSAGLVPVYKTEINNVRPNSEYVVGYQGQTAVVKTTNAYIFTYLPAGHQTMTLDGKEYNVIVTKDGRATFGDGEKSTLDLSAGPITASKHSITATGTAEYPLKFDVDGYKIVTSKPGTANRLVVHDALPITLSNVDLTYGYIKETPIYMVGGSEIELEGQSWIRRMTTDGNGIESAFVGQDYGQLVFKGNGNLRIEDQAQYATTIGGNLGKGANILIKDNAQVSVARTSGGGGTGIGGGWDRNTNLKALTTVNITDNAYVQVSRDRTSILSNIGGNGDVNVTISGKAEVVVTGGSNGAGGGPSSPLIGTHNDKPGTTQANITITEGTRVTVGVTATSSEVLGSGMGLPRNVPITSDITNAANIRISPFAAINAPSRENYYRDTTNIVALYKATARDLGLPINGVVDVTFDGITKPIRTWKDGSLTMYLPQGQNDVYIDGTKYNVRVNSKGTAIFGDFIKENLDVTRGNVFITGDSSIATLPGFRPDGSQANFDPDGYVVSGTTNQYSILINDYVPVDIYNVSIDVASSNTYAISTNDGAELTLFGTNTINRSHSNGAAKALIGQNSGQIIIKGEGTLDIVDSDSSNTTLGGNNGKPGNILIQDDIRINITKKSTSGTVAGSAIGGGQGTYTAPTNIVIKDNVKINAAIEGTASIPVIGGYADTNILISDKADVIATGGSAGHAVVMGAMDYYAKATIVIDDGTRVKVTVNSKGNGAGLTSAGMGLPSDGKAIPPSVAERSKIRISPWANVIAPSRENYYTDPYGLAPVFKATAKGLEPNTMVEVERKGDTAMMETFADGTLGLYLYEGIHDITLDGTKYRTTVNRDGSAIIGNGGKVVLDISKGSILIKNNSITGFTPSGEQAPVNVEGYEIVGTSATNNIEVWNAIPISIRDLHLSGGQYLYMKDGGDLTVHGANTFERSSAQASKDNNPLIGQYRGQLNIDGQGSITLTDNHAKATTIGGRDKRPANIRIGGDVTIVANKRGFLDAIGDPTGYSPIIGGGAAAIDPVNIVITDNAKVQAHNIDNYWAPAIGAGLNSIGSVNVEISGRAQLDATQTAGEKSFSAPAIGMYSNINVPANEYPVNIDIGAGTRVSVRATTPKGTTGAGMGVMNHFIRPDAKNAKVIVSPLANVDALANENFYTNARFQPVYKVAVPQKAPNTELEISRGGETAKVSTDKLGNMWLYLPLGKQYVTIDGVEYSSEVKSDGGSVFTDGRQTVLDISLGTIIITKTAVTGFMPGGVAAKFNPAGYEITGSTKSNQILVYDAVPITLNNVYMSSLNYDYAIYMDKGGQITVRGEDNSIHRGYTKAQKGLIGQNSGQISILGDGKLFLRDESQYGATIGGHQGRDADVYIGDSVRIHILKAQSTFGAAIGAGWSDPGTDTTSVHIGGNANVDIEYWYGRNGSSVIGNTWTADGDVKVKFSGRANVNIKPTRATTNNNHAPMIGTGGDTTAKAYIDIGPGVNLVLGNDNSTFNGVINGSGIGIPINAPITADVKARTKTRVSPFANIEVAPRESFNAPDGTTPVYRTIIAGLPANKDVAILSSGTAQGVAKTFSNGELNVYLPAGNAEVFVDNVSFTGVVNTGGYSKLIRTPAIKAGDLSANPAQGPVGINITGHAVSPSPAPITYSIVNPGSTGITLSGNLVKWTREGTAVLKASQPAVGSFTAAETTFSLQIIAVPEDGIRGVLDIGQGNVAITNYSVTGKTVSGARALYDPDGYEITGTTTENTIVVNDGQDIAIRDINIDYNTNIPTAIKMTSGASIIVLGTNNINRNINTDDNSLISYDSGMLTILGDGTLNMKDAEDIGPTIGGNAQKAVDIRIEGDVTINATKIADDIYSPVIGAGNGANAKVVITDNAKVNATHSGMSNSAVIGLASTNATNVKNADITISGRAQVVATGGVGGVDAAVIGTDNKGNSVANITIEEGTYVKVVSRSDSRVGVVGEGMGLPMNAQSSVVNGSIKISEFANVDAPANENYYKALDNKTHVYKSIGSGFEPNTDVSLTKGNKTVSVMADNDGKLNLYLPEGDREVSVDEVKISGPIDQSGNSKLLRDTVITAENIEKQITDASVGVDLTDHAVSNSPVVPTYAITNAANTGATLTDNILKWTAQGTIVLNASQVANDLYKMAEDTFNVEITGPQKDGILGLLDISQADISITETSVTAKTVAGIDALYDPDGYEIIGSTTTNKIVVRDAVPITLNAVTLEYSSDKIGTAIHMVQGGEITFEGINTINRNIEQTVNHALIGQDSGELILTGHGTLEIIDQEDTGATIGGNYKKPGNIHIRGNVTINAVRPGDSFAPIIGAGYMSNTNTKVTISENAKVNASMNRSAYAAVIGLEDSSSATADISILGNADVTATSGIRASDAAIIGTNNDSNSIANITIGDGAKVKIVDRAKNRTSTAAGIGISSGSEITSDMKSRSNIKVSPFANVSAPDREDYYKDSEGKVAVYKATGHEFTPNTMIDITHGAKTVPVKTSDDGTVSLYLPLGEQRVLMDGIARKGTVDTSGTTRLYIETVIQVNDSSVHLSQGLQGINLENYVTTNSKGVAIEYRLLSIGTSDATISGTTLNWTKPGTVKIHTSQPAHGEFLAASSELTIVITTTKNDMQLQVGVADSSEGQGNIYILDKDSQEILPFVTVGEEVVLTAVPNEGYQLEKWVKTTKPTRVQRVMRAFTRSAENMSAMTRENLPATNELTIVVEENVEYTAFFKVRDVGLDVLEVSSEVIQQNGTLVEQNKPLIRQDGSESVSFDSNALDYGLYLRSIDTDNINVYVRHSDTEKIEIQIGDSPNVVVKPFLEHKVSLTLDKVAYQEIPVVVSRGQETKTYIIKVFKPQKVENDPHIFAELEISPVKEVLELGIYATNVDVNAFAMTIKIDDLLAADKKAFSAFTSNDGTAFNNIDTNLSGDIKNYFNLDSRFEIADMRSDGQFISFTVNMKTTNGAVTDSIKFGAKPEKVLSISVKRNPNYTGNVIDEIDTLKMEQVTKTNSIYGNSLSSKFYGDINDTFEPTRAADEKTLSYLVFRGKHDFIKMYISYDANVVGRVKFEIVDVSTPDKPKVAISGDVVNKEIVQPIIQSTYKIKVFSGGYLLAESEDVVYAGEPSKDGIIMTPVRLLEGDLDNNGIIDTQDRTKIISVLNQNVLVEGSGFVTVANEDIYADYNNDNRINSLDLGRLVQNIGKKYNSIHKA